MSPYPDWLRILSWAYLSVSFVCAALIIGDELRRPQKMMIMNFVWPITALYLGPAALWGYLRSGSKIAQLPHRQAQREVPAEPNALTREQVALATTHCGAGCALGDIVSEWSVFAIALTFAGGEFPTRLTMDLLLGWAFGIVFQYFTIVPMRRLSFGRGLFQAIRADTLAIVAFEIGLFAWMTFAHYVLFPLASSSAHRSGLLVHDADRHDCRLFHVISGQHLSSQDRLEGKDAAVSRDHLRKLG
jgi:hypothetical protein